MYTAAEQDVQEGLLRRQQVALLQLGLQGAHGHPVLIIVVSITNKQTNN